MHIKSLVLAAAVALASISSVATAATSLIGNGNFEAGNTGFVSAYVNSPTNLQPAGTYGVISNPLDAHPLWSSFGDHTTGSGLMMAMNGASTVTTV